MKRPLIISLILLLLIGGGGVAFRLHLREQALPQFSEVDAFLLNEVPAQGKWEYVWIPGNVNKWGALSESWSKRTLGIGTSTFPSVNGYGFSRYPEVTRVWVTVVHDFQKITNLVIEGEPTDTRLFSQLLLEKFPALRHVLQVNP